MPINENSACGTTIQQGDVHLFNTADGGDISVADGVFEMTPGLCTMAYLCLFGGNQDDDGSDASNLQWWGNIGELDLANQYRSETQNLIDGLPATSNNVLKLKNAAQRDLQVMITEGVANSVVVSVSIPALNEVKISVNISAVAGGDVEIEFIETWKAMARI